MSEGPTQSPESSRVASPFSGNEEIFPKATKGNSRLLIFGIAIGILVLIAGGIGGVFIMGHLNDPYRTMEPFPVAKFLESPLALLGSRFRGELRVEANLGYKEGIGKLMLFSTTEDPRPIAVMVPEAVARDIYFTKGQVYMAELEVKEGGLIYANSCRKN